MGERKIEAFRTTLTVVGLLVVFAAITKSAQLPFSAWLPAAMAAPTPVSALVHSSTLVTAGVYLLIRFQGSLGGGGRTRNGGLILIACLTMFMAGLGANLEMDLKKIVALSTLRQLGLMVATLGMGYPELAFFHLITHALFKALLFICAGSYIHSLGDNQDIRWMGGMGLHIPLTSGCFVVSNMALCGLPFLAGFYSKDVILETVTLTPLNGGAWGLYFLATGLTARYTVRLVGVVLASPHKGQPAISGEGENWGIQGPMMGLTLFAITGGSLLAWGLLPSPPTIVLPPPLRGLTMGVVALGGLMGAVVSNWGSVEGANHRHSLLPPVLVACLGGL